ncbi:MAG: hypothetical protein GY846_07615 [Deltaproteobacteria bacterium]|nr:hypothetical protein [Deltaproteobacteria bacterium]
MEKDDLVENGMSVNILINKEGGLFVAHCLELDIVTTGDSFVQVQKDVVALICAQIDYAFSNDNLENLFHPAPKEVWAEFYKCRERTEKRHLIDATFAQEGGDRPFVPPWIITKTCGNIDQHNV